MRNEHSIPDAMYDKRVNQLAYEYWKQRGRPIGSPEIDWWRAEEEIKREMNPLCKKVTE